MKITATRKITQAKFMVVTQENWNELSRKYEGLKFDVNDYINIDNDKDVYVAKKENFERLYTVNELSIYPEYLQKLVKEEKCLTNKIDKGLKYYNDLDNNKKTEPINFHLKNQLSHMMSYRSELQIRIFIAIKNEKLL